MVGAANSPFRKVLVIGSMVVGFVAVADGLAMLLPGPSSSLGGAMLLVMGGAWLVLGIPRLLSTAGRPFSHVLVARFGLLVVPPLSIPIAGLWFVATPSALSAWFLVAWFAVWSACVVLSAWLPCPQCGGPFGRVGWRLQVASSACPHCGASPRTGGD